MTQVDDLSRSLVAFEQSSTMVIVVEMSQSSWLVAGVVPGLDRRPLKKVDPNPATLLRLLEGWREQAVRSDQLVSRIAICFSWPVRARSGCHDDEVCNIAKVQACLRMPRSRASDNLA